MESLPTIEECSSWILEHCQIILSYIEKENFDIKDLAQTTYDSTKILINALDISKKDKSKLFNKLDRYSKFKQNNNMMKLLIINIKEICCQVTKIVDLNKRQLSVMSTDRFQRERERILPSCKVDHNWLDQVDEKAFWFRNHFVGKPYITLIGPIMDDRDDLAVISIVKEYEKHANQKQPFIQYRIIVRTKQDINMGFIVQESDAKELILQLDESLGQTHNKLDVEVDVKRHRPLRSFSSAIITSMTNHQIHQNQHKSSLSTKVMRAAILFLFHDINFSLFKELSAEATILAGLEQEFLRYDEVGIPKSYKFGILMIKDGQDTEEEWFSNSGLSTGLEKLLNIIGKPIQLKDYKGYAAGLDTKTGESGEISYISTWKDHEIMFHVAPLMPSRDHDKQQIHRKRYIGNDIVCIVFLEGTEQKFDPNSIRSQFLHVFIIVHWEVINGRDTWRVEVIHDVNVKEFLPHIPSPPLFTNEDELADFLILKLINAENSSLKSDKFTLPNNKARLEILKSLVETGIEASQVSKSFHGNRSHGKSGGGGGERPKSAGAHQQVGLRNNFKSSQALVYVDSVDTASNTYAMIRSTTPELPPVPSISRSNVLRDIKSLTRRRSGGGAHHAVRVTHRSASPKISEISIIDGTQSGSSTLEREERMKPVLECLAECPNTVTTNSSANTGIGIRYKAHNLMNTMIGRRNSRTGLSHHSS